MGTAMQKAILAALAAILLVGVLSVLIVESRAVDEGYYIAHSERIGAIESSRNELTAVMQSTKGAFENGRPVADATALGFTRLAETNNLLQKVDAELRENAGIDTQLTAYDAALARFIQDGEIFVSQQTAYAGALRTVQEESPLVVKDLRRFKLDLQAQVTFSLAIDIIEYATGSGSKNNTILAQRVDKLKNDRTIEAQIPGTLDNFTNAAETLFVQRDAAEKAVQAVSGNRILETLWTLSNELLDENSRVVSRAERANLLLSVCTVLLLIGVGYAMYRLQGSYRELNKSNHKLAALNDSLEERVSERTHELSDAYEDLQESQVQLVQAEKMSSLGELVAGISHEINTPLWYLISNSTVLKERLEDVDKLVGISETMIEALKSGGDARVTVRRGLIDIQNMLKDGLRDDIDEAKDLIGDSIEGLEELTELAQGLKDFSRLDRAHHGEFNVNDGLDKTLLIAKNRLKSKVNVHKHYGDVPDIRCSPSQINQIFLNLLTNAADAIEESGDVVIQTTTEGDTVRVSIADTGSGIAEEVMAKIRDPFFTTKEVGKGTGLGLSIVDQIITSHGGELLIESEPGRGTTVTVVLPLLAPQTEEATDASAAANDPEVSVEAVAATV
jgi:signal transduction histidine kinase